MSKTIYLSTPTNSRKGQFDFIYAPINYTIITSNIFEYKQALSIIAELSIMPLELNSDLLEIYIYVNLDLKYLMYSSNYNLYQLT